MFGCTKRLICSALSFLVLPVRPYVRRRKFSCSFRATCSLITSAYPNIRRLVRCSKHKILVPARNHPFHSINPSGVTSNKAPNFPSAIPRSCRLSSSRFRAPSKGS
jgi:hypothetical protein